MSELERRHGRPLQGVEEEVVAEARPRLDLSGRGVIGPPGEPGRCLAGGSTERIVPSHASGVIARSRTPSSSGTPCADGSDLRLYAYGCAEKGPRVEVPSRTAPRRDGLPQPRAEKARLSALRTPQTGSLSRRTSGSACSMGPERCAVVVDRATPNVDPSVRSNVWPTSSRAQIVVIGPSRDSASRALRIATR